MSSFLYALGRGAFRRRRLVLTIWLAALAFIGGLAGLFGQSFDDSFSLPGTQSQTALDSLNLTFPSASGSSAQVVFVAPEGQNVREPAVEKAVGDAVHHIAALHQVDTAVSPFGKGVKGAISANGHAAIVNVQFDGQRADITTATTDRLTAIARQLQTSIPGSRAEAGGDAYGVTGVQLSIVEALGVVIALIVLFLTLGSMRAAGMPLLTALLGVGISMTLIVGATALTTVSSTTPMLALMLGLAVGIDYALFILSRHRDQLGHGMDVEESAARSVATAGSAVVFAGLTVMIALVGLAVARIPFLTTMGIAAAAAVVVAVLIALTLLPALLGFAGDKLRPRQGGPRRPEKPRADGSPAEDPADGGRPSRGERRPREPHRLARGWVRTVTRWPALTIAVVLVGLGAMSLPALDLRLALPDNGSSDPGTPARVTYDLIGENFGEGHNGPLIVTGRIIGSTDPLGVLDHMADDIRKLPGVADIPVVTPNQNADTGIIQVIPEGAPDSAQTKQLVNDIRGLNGRFEREYGVSTAVTGVTALGIDVSDRLGAALLPFGILVVGLSLVLLTMVFRSIAVPLKATLGYLLSVGASFGATAMVFEYGWFSGPLNVDQLGPVISFLPIILMGVLFGLAMDYEVFLVSRIREDYVHGGNARKAIETGFVSSSRVVVAAAIIMFAVFAAFVPEGESTIKTIALGLAVGVFVDAFIVRMTFVPAVLALLGDKAWWLPRWLDKALPSFDVEGESLTHQLALAQWPSADSDHLVYGEGLALESQFGPVYSGIDIAARPGEVLVVEGAVGSGKTSLLLSLAGRMTFGEGRAKVAGLVLPEQASGIRRRTGFVDCRRSEDVGTDLRLMLRGRPAVVFLDDVDTVTSPDDRQAIAMLLDDVVTAGLGRAVVVGVEDAFRIESLLPDGARRLRLPSRGAPGDYPLASSSGLSGDAEHDGPDAPVAQALSSRSE